MRRHQLILASIADGIAPAMLHVGTEDLDINDERFFVPMAPS
jgi:hypothetical protein